MGLKEIKDKIKDIDTKKIKEQIVEGTSKAYGKISDTARKIDFKDITNRVIDNTKKITSETKDWLNSQMISRQMKCPVCESKLEKDKEKSTKKIYRYTCLKCGKKLNVDVEKVAVLKNYLLDLKEQFSHLDFSEVKEIVKDPKHPFTIALIGLVAWGVLNFMGFTPFITMTTVLGFLLGGWGLVLLFALSTVIYLHRKKILEKAEELKKKFKASMFEGDIDLSLDPEKRRTTLTITSTERCLIYKLKTDDNLMLPEKRKNISFELLEDIQKKIFSIFKDDLYTNKSEIISKINSYTHQIIPKEIIDLLENYISSDLLKNITLELDSYLLNFPFELLIIDNEFMGCALSVSRELSEIPIKRKRYDFNKELKVIIIADTLENLESAYKEGELLQTAVEKFKVKGKSLKVDFFSGRHIKKLFFLEKLNEYDIVHYCGHTIIQDNKPELSGFPVTDGTVNLNEISSLANPPFLFFANSCSSSINLSEGLLKKDSIFLAKSMLQTGLSNFIGTVWDVEDNTSLRFATEFYHRLFDGETVGAALKNSRIDIMNKKDIKTYNYLSYIMFGNVKNTLG